MATSSETKMCHSFQFMKGRTNLQLVVKTEDTLDAISDKQSKADNQNSRL